MFRSLSILLLLLMCSRAHAQGCSDAGVCTAGPVGGIATAADSTAFSDHRHSARITFGYAIGERGVTVIQLLPQLDLRITERLGLQLKMPWVHASGDLGGNSGAGDPVISSSYAIIYEDDRRLYGTLGMKFPVNDANALEGEKPLPMPYQTSLGTTDVLIGLSYRKGRWSAALAYQHVLAQQNRNGFVHDVWMDDMRAVGYFESFHLQRASDAVGRLQYVFPIKRIEIKPGLLAIVHTGKDSREIPGTNERVPIDGSEGLTLNATIDAKWNLGSRSALMLGYASPVITRDVRPDGLTRSMVMSLGLSIGFGAK